MVPHGATMVQELLQTGQVIQGEKDGDRREEDAAALLDLGGSTGYSGYSTLHVRVEVSSWGMNAGKEQTVISLLNLPCTN